MNTLKLSEHSFSSVKQLCKSVINSTALKVRLMPQCIEVEKVGLCRLSQKMVTVLSVNNIECIEVPSSFLNSPDARKILLLLFNLNIKLCFEPELTNSQMKLLPLSILRRTTFG